MLIYSEIAIVSMSHAFNCTVMELKLIYSYRLILRSGS